jgi:hypothetical protein
MRLTDEQLRDELTELRETPGEDFAAELDAWAAEGFPPPGSERRSTARRVRPSFASRVRGLRLRPFLPAMGMATLLIGVVIVVTSRETDREVVPESADPPGIVAPESADDSGGAGDAAPGAARLDRTTAEPVPLTVPPAPPREQLKPGRERVQERSASMALSTEAGEVDDVADGVVEVTERYEGIVVRSDVSTGAERGRATFDLRIPTASLQAALADLSDLASVSARNEGTLDITAPFVSAEERFEDAKAEVDALREELAEADDASEIASIREQLRVARGELAGARSELGALKQRADFSRLAVTVTGDGDADGWSLGDAADDAVSVLEDLLGAGLVALAVIVPLGGLALLGWIGWGRLRRRRRESALDDGD